MRKIKNLDNWPERHLYRVISSHDVEYEHRSFRTISKSFGFSGKAGLKGIRYLSVRQFMKVLYWASFWILQNVDVSYIWWPPTFWEKWDSLRVGRLLKMRSSASSICQDSFQGLVHGRGFSWTPGEGHMYWASFWILQNVDVSYIFLILSRWQCYKYYKCLRLIPYLPASLKLRGG